METRTIELPTPHGPMSLYEAEPDGGGPGRGAVIVVQEAFGVTEHIEDVTRRVAAEGYRAVAPHVFHRAGGGTVPYGQFDKVLEKFKGLDDDAVLVDIDAALDHLRTAGFRDAQIGIVGFCFGGRVTFLTAISRSIGAAVGFYGGGIVTQPFTGAPALIERAADLRTPWLGLFGDLDKSIPVEGVERLRAELDHLDVAHEVVRYPDAGHGFHRDVGDDYVPGAAADAWQRTLDWFERHLG